MSKQHAKELLEKYTAGLCAEQEKAVVEGWYLNLPAEGAYPTFDRIEKSKEEVWKLLDIQKTSHHNTLLFKICSAAAAVLICLTAIVHYSPFFKKSKVTQQHFAVQDIAPGGNKATLILANGRRIILDGAINGKIAEESGVLITKTSDGQLSFQISETGLTNPGMYHTVVTPMGGQYQVALPDGTRVWLNAASSLRFPAAFGGRQRQVELSGEAYFEVAKNPALPFKVMTDFQEVEVLGTHFNINCYQDENNTKTTLFEGAVKVSGRKFTASKVLSPGQQALLENDGFIITAIDMDEALAWKNGLFVFNNESLESIMRKVSRWYNVEIEYEDEEVRKEIFGGSVSRFGKVSELLRMLEITGNVHFKISADKITAMKK